MDTYDGRRSEYACMADDDVVAFYRWRGLVSGVRETTDWIKNMLAAFR